MAVPSPLDTTHYQLSKEKTPSGRSRYLFRYGKWENSFVLFKFSYTKTVGTPPECMLFAFTMRDFVKAAKDLGCHISKKEQTELAA